VERLVRQAQAVHHAGTEVLHDDVGAVADPERDVDPGRIMQVEETARLLRFYAVEVSAIVPFLVIAEEGPERTRRIAGRGST